MTDREMKRYFMTIPEAVSLVLQASILGNGGEVFVLDMGDPVPIVHIAEELIRIHGMEPYKDIDIQFTGLRPGEKLFEEILTAEEGTDASRHEKIFIARNDAKYTLPDLPAILNEFNAIISDPSPESNAQMKSLLRKYVKYYTHDTAMSAECRAMSNEENTNLGSGDDPNFISGMIKIIPLLLDNVLKSLLYLYSQNDREPGRWTKWAAV